MPLRATLTNHRSKSGHPSQARGGYRLIQEQQRAHEDEHEQYADAVAQMYPASVSGV